MPNPKVREFLVDPEVMQLDPATQRELAAQIDPEVGKYSPDVYNLFVSNLRHPKKRTRKVGEALGDAPEGMGIRQALENLTPDIAMGLTGQALDKIVPKMTKNPAVQFGAPLLGRVLMHYGSQYAQANLPPDYSPFKYQAQQPTLLNSFGESALDKGTSLIGDAAIAIKEAGGVKNAIGLKLAKRYPLTEAAAKDLPEANTFAHVAGIDNPLANAMGPGMFVDTAIGLASTKKKVDFLNKFNAGLNQRLSKAFGGKFQTVKALTNLSPQKLAIEAQRNVLEARRIAYNLEDTAWGRIDMVTNASPKVVQYEEVVQEPAKYIKNQYGQQIMVSPATTKTVLKDKVVNGVIRVPKPAEFSQVLQGGVAKLFQDPQAMFPQNGPLQSQIASVKSIVDQLANMKPSYLTAPDGTQTIEYLTSYETTKALRNGLRKLMEVTHEDSSQAALLGAAKKLQGLLSEAEAASIGDATLGWIPGSRQAYEQAVAVTKDRVARFSGETGGGILAETRQLRDPSTLGLDEVTQLNKAMRTVTGAEQLVAANNGDATDVATHYLKEIFHKSLKKDGSLDGEKFYNMLFDNGTNQSILESDKIFRPGQRRIIRGLAMYARANKLNLDPSSGGIKGWVASKAAYGVIALAAGAGAVALGSENRQNQAIAGTMAIGIPFASHFIQSLILNPKGAALLEKMLYGAASQQQAQGLTRSMLKMLPKGAQAYVISNNGKYFHQAEVDKDGRVKLVNPPSQ